MALCVHHGFRWILAPIHFLGGEEGGGGVHLHVRSVIRSVWGGGVQGVSTP